MKFKPRSGIYSNYNGNCTYDPITQEAYSYKWWRFVEKINGHLVFNNATYSVCTSKHQGKMQNLLNKLDLKYTTILVPDGLQNVDTAIEYWFNIYADAKTQYDSNPRRTTRLHTISRAEKQIEVLLSIGMKKLTKKKQKEILKRYKDRETRCVETKKQEKLLLKRSINKPINELLEA